MDGYSLKERVPKCLPCGHTFCSICLLKLLGHRSIICPNCKAKHNVPVISGVDGLSTNHAIFGLLDYCCDDCRSYSRTSTCSHCQLALCASCLDYHIKSEFEQPVLESLDQAHKAASNVTDHLPVFVNRINRLLEDCDLFCVQSRRLIQNKPSVDELTEVDDQAVSHINRLRAVDDLVTLDVSDPGLTSDSIQAVKSVFKKPVTTTANEPIISSRPHATSSHGNHVIPEEHVTSSECERVRLSTSEHLAPCYTHRQVFGQQGATVGEFRFPTAAETDISTGNIHITDFGNRRVCVYSCTNEATHLTSYDVGTKPHDLCFIQDGYVAIAGDDNRITICDLTGSVKERIGRKGSKLGEFDYPSGITTDGEGLFYVCDRNNRRVQVLDQSGSVVRVLGRSGPGILDHPVSVAIHPHTRHIYVADYSRNDRVNIYTHDGQYQHSIWRHSIPGVKGFSPRYVAFNNDGFLCISDTYNNCGHLFKDGRYIQRLGDRTAPICWPMGATFADNDIIVCENDKHKVHVFSKNTQH